ncbi:MAG: shikimate kinase, partial [Nostoc sp.]
PVEIIYSRLADDTTRPLLQDVDPQGKLRSLLEQRTPLYSQADLHIIEREGDTPEDVAKRVLEAIPTVLKTQVSH